jgi:hypothetical protein
LHPIIGLTRVFDTDTPQDSAETLSRYKTGMKQRTGLIAKVVIAGALLSLAIYALPLGKINPVMATYSRHQSGKNQLGNGERKAWVAQAPTIMNGVMAPLNSLRLMKRAIAASPTVDTSDVPILAILQEPIKTTGLGPIQIGMTKAEVNAVGLTLVPIDGSGLGECQY